MTDKEELDKLSCLNIDWVNLISLAEIKQTEL
jgi:hypothetical protein